MRDDITARGAPAALPAIEAATRAMGFELACEARTGALLRSLAATKPGGRLLELGTGTGASTSWLLDGMDASSTLVTVDSDPAVSGAAQRVLGADPRVRFVVGDGGALLSTLASSFDLIFADAWPGKYDHLEAALARVAPGGLYVIDDMLPQATWPEGHAPRVAALLEILDARADFVVTRLAWASGIVIATRRA